MTKEWKALVRNELRQRGLNQTEFADLCGVTPSAVTVFFRSTTRTCRFVEKIVAALDVPRPEHTDNREAEVFADFRELRRLDPAGFDEEASRIRKPRGSSAVCARELGKFSGRGALLRDTLRTGDFPSCVGPSH